MAAHCRKCGAEFAPRPHQIRKSDLRCSACVNQAALEYRQRRAREGRPPLHHTPRAREARRAYETRSYHQSAETRMKRKARAWLRKAVERGQIARMPCEKCGATPAEGHHDDYSRPLEVRWLCPTHHREHHAAERARSAT